MYEIRDPIHGFVTINEWERDIINHPVFQRLRRIRQLSLTDMVYPGAMHNRFEHSLGVMHVATRMFDHIREKRLEFLKSQISFTEGGLEKDRMIVRLASLLHDVGHAPLSHAAEGLMDKDPITGKSYKHEHYSAAAVSFLMEDIIENHPLNQNYNIKAKDIADFLKGEISLGRCRLWRNLISSQLDADRADYLLRDSHHIGVAYGHYDLNRLLATLRVAINPETDLPVLAVEEGGEHVVEALIIARYMMFTQVYFQHTRRAYDFHSVQAIRQLLAEQQKGSNLTNKNAFPPPISKENMEDYLKWDDWRVLGLISNGKAGEHGRILMERKHYRTIFETPEIPSPADLEFAKEIERALGDNVGFVDCASSSWYKFETADIPMLLRPGQNDEQLTTLSMRSSVVSGLKAVERTRIYVPMEKKEEARKLVADKRKEKEKMQ
ncbi:MAG: HD domain-containing protein [Candidatus Omnitrophota bacterium]|nr:MAG: HD domain-containing protein [Candidatus Omnitrophota bacterium]